MTPRKFLFPPNIYSKESKWGKIIMQKTLLKGTMVTMMACSPFLIGTAAYASENTDAVKTTETTSKH